MVHWAKLIPCDDISWCHKPSLVNVTCLSRDLNHVDDIVWEPNKCYTSVCECVCVHICMYKHVHVGLCAHEYARMRASWITSMVHMVKLSQIIITCWCPYLEIQSTWLRFLDEAIKIPFCRHLLGYFFIREYKRGYIRGFIRSYIREYIRGYIRGYIQHQRGSVGW